MPSNDRGDGSVIIVSINPRELREQFRVRDVREEIQVDPETITAQEIITRVLSRATWDIWSFAAPLPMLNTEILLKLGKTIEAVGRTFSVLIHESEEDIAKTSGGRDEYTRRILDLISSASKINMSLVNELIELMLSILNRYGVSLPVGFASPVAHGMGFFRAGLPILPNSHVARIGDMVEEEEEQKGKPQQAKQ